ncbi:phosphatase PAP2 family protein [Kytococcus sedentarius]|uniref:phosphatase PAP2 family protein n=1 Tax=Kytococcus sedentarius TaxID=1276 RepID=UPI0035BBFC1F
MPLLRRAASLPVLSAAFVVLTALSMGVLLPLDRELHRYWSQEHTPYATDLFLMLDALAGQAVAVPVLALTAAVLGWRARSWEPLRMVLLVEAAFFGGVGTLKLLLARGTPAMEDPHFFVGRLDGTGWQGISYPSGHTAEAVLIYGAAVYLLCTHLQLGRGARGALLVAWAGTVLLTVGVAWWLGFHWVTDLVAGLLLGGVLLHLVVLADQWFTERRPRVLLPPALD